MIVEFRSKLRTEDLDDERAVLIAPLVAVVDGKTVTVPAGVQTDFASVPRLPLAYYLAGGTARRASVLHDWLYQQQVDRKWADDVFYEAMKADGVPAWRRSLMWAAVRAFGGGPYRGKVA